MSDREPTEPSEPESPFMRAYVEAAALQDAEPTDLSRDSLADRLVDRFNQNAPGGREAAPAVGVEMAAQPEWRAWILCRAVVRRVGDLKIGTRFRRPLTQGLQPAAVVVQQKQDRSLPSL